MRTMGFPEQGYCELKIQDTFERNVNIITEKGNVDITYECGLPQGEVLSCIVSNMILMRKHKMWRISADTKDMSPIEEDGNPLLHGYTFKYKDRTDKEHLIVDMDRYCDDNKRFVHSNNVDEMIC